MGYVYSAQGRLGHEDPSPHWMGGSFSPVPHRAGHGDSALPVEGNGDPALCLVGHVPSTLHLVGHGDPTLGRLPKYITPLCMIFITVGEKVFSVAVRK